LLAAGAIWLNHFGLFVLANMLAGAYQAFAQYYRFAAVDVASPEFKSKAIAWVMAGGVVAAIAGPNIARFTQNIGSPPFIVSSLAFSALSFAALLLIRCLVVPAIPESVIHGSVRPLWQIIRQPIFLMALTSSAVGYGAMTMVMTATPLAMTLCGHTFGASATVIQWHVLGMFIPSFFTGHLIRRFGVLTIIAVGVALLATHITIALTGEALLNYLSGLILLGVAWNFLFIGGTSLLIKAYRPAEAAKVQAVHDFLIFAVVSLASFSAGSLLNSFGWRFLNMMVMPFLILVLAMIFILRTKLKTDLQ
jgi:predicted MFS family arabinose efflux permease